MPIGAAKFGVFAGSDKVGDLITGHSFNTGTVWAVSSHLSGSSKLGTELISGSALTVTSPAAVTATHPDNSAQLGVSCPKNGGNGLFEGAVADLDTITSDFSIVIDMTVTSTSGYHVVWNWAWNGSYAAPYARIALSHWPGGTRWKLDWAVGGVQNEFNLTNASFTLSSSTRYQIGFTKSGASMNAYHNAVTESGTGGTSSDLDQTGGNPSYEPNMTCFSADDPSRDIIGADIHRCQCWDRVITGTEFSNFRTDPRIGTYV